MPPNHEGNGTPTSAPCEEQLSTATARIDTLQRELADMRAEVEETARMKDDFLATLSHELRTPLGAVLGWARMLRERAHDANALERGLEVIERNARAQAALVEDILDMSRLSRGKMKLAMADVDPRATIEDAISAVAHAAEAKGVGIVSSFADVGHLPGDGARLRQVVWNLLSNAVKFTPAGGHVRVTLSRAPTVVRIVVEDDGEGIDAGFLPHVFESFRQADGSPTRVHGGLGLGLSIVRQLVELHGGRVLAESEGALRGSRFTVELPLPAVQLAPAKAPDPSMDRRDLRGVRVLVVDDDQDARELVKLVLSRAGASVSTASGPSEAQRMVSEVSPDVVVSDLAMPGEDGFSLVRALQAQGRKAPPVIALTGYARKEDRERALDAGFAGYVRKPVLPAELVRAIAGALPRGVPPIAAPRSPCAA